MSRVGELDFKCGCGAEVVGLLLTGHLLDVMREHALACPALAAARNPGLAMEPARTSAGDSDVEVFAPGTDGSE